MPTYRFHEQSSEDSRHPVISWSPADETEREAIVVTAEDVNKLARQLDNNTVWLQTSEGPVSSWVSLGTATGSGDFLADGSIPMTGDLQMGTNGIVNVGNVDGRDVSADGTAQDAHIAAANPHSGSASDTDLTSHTDAANPHSGSASDTDLTSHTGAVNPHSGSASSSDLTSHTGDATIHFAEDAIDHTAILNVGTNTHTVIDAFIAAQTSVDPSTLSDGEYYAFGPLVTVPVAENTVGVSGVLSIAYADGEYYDADNSATVGRVNMLVVAVEAGTGNRLVMPSGIYRNDSWAWSVVADRRLWVNSAGALTQTEPSVALYRKAVGYVISSNTIWFDPTTQPDVIDPVVDDIEITHTGGDFEAIVVAPGADILWTFPDASTSTSDHPDVSGVGAGTTTLSVTPWSAITMLNVGYADGVDGSELGPEFDVPGQNVTAITNIQSAPNLAQVCAMYNTGLSTLDLSGQSSIENVELFGCSGLASIDLTGCTSLKRICVEANNNNLTSLDVSAALALEDLRGSGNTNLSTLVLPPAGNQGALWHVCVGNTSLGANKPDPSNMTALEDFYINDSGATGSITFVSEVLSNVRLYNTSLTSLTVTGNWSGGYNNLNAYSASFTSVDITDCTGLLAISLNDNNLTEASVDALLAEIESWGTSNGTVNLSGNAEPSAAGLADKATLEGRGWTVTVDTGALWEDDFDRADGAPGNGWTAYSLAAASIVSNHLVRTENSGYQVYYNPTDVTLPADYRYTMTVPHTTLSTNNWGLTVRWTAASGNGTRVFFPDPNTITVGDAASSNQNDTTVTITGGFPGTWTNNIDHTFGVEVEGTTVRIILDGVEYGTATHNVNNTTGTGVGNVGQGLNRAWDNAIVTSV